MRILRPPPSNRKENRARTSIISRPGYIKDPRTKHLDPAAVNLNNIIDLIHQLFHLDNGIDQPSGNTSVFLYSVIMGINYYAISQLL